MSYIINQKADTSFMSAKGNKIILQPETFESALLDFQSVIEQIDNTMPGIDLFAILGMRNISSLISELFVASMVKHCNNIFLKNPHQDGYPDLILMDNYGQQLLAQLKNSNKLRDKSPFSPFENGGVEVKATCGSVPSPTKCAQKGKQKPGLGDTRIDLMTGYDWKAHHRLTNNLIGILWDFNNCIPNIVAVFFCNTLNENDWSKIVQPKEGGGRTTSVSIMSRGGVNKMYHNWIAVKDDQKYINFINTYNRGNLILKDS